MPRLNAPRKTTTEARPVRRRPTSPAMKLGIRYGAVAGVVLLVVGGVAWAVGGGHAARWTEQVRTGFVQSTVDVGFSVEEVLVEGRDLTPAEDLLAALGVERKDPILWFDPDSARDAIEEIAWVEDVMIQRRLPDTILVTIAERVPVAIWQHEQKLQLIDAEGNVLADSGLSSFSHLPQVVGADAHLHAMRLITALDDRPMLAQRVQASVRVGDRRWDLHLTNDVVINLPEERPEDALDRLIAVEREEGLFDRDIVSIDLRLEDRLVIRTTPLATERRALPEEQT